MPFCEANGIRIHYRRTGDGPSIVMLHGLLGAGACWTPVARALGLDAILPDARGHGESSAPAAGYRYDDLADDVVGLIEKLELDRPILLGHSMGGMTAAVVASRGVALRGLVLVDPTFLSAERQREVYASDVVEQHRRALATPAAELLAEARARHPHRSAEILELQIAARLKTSLDAFAVLAPPNPDYREVMNTITVPTLLVIGDSPVVTLDIASELGVEVAVIEHAGHGVPFDQPERLAAVIAGFVRTCTSTIESDTLRLRPPTMADAREWLAGEDDEMARGFEFPRRSTQADVERAIERWAESWKTDGPVRCWAICDVTTDAIVGGVELRQLDPGVVNLSYWVAPAWRRRGIATRAAELALDYAATAMHASRVVLEVLEGNVASLGVARHLDAREAGTRPSDAGGTFLVFHRAL